MPCTHRSGPYRSPRTSARPSSPSQAPRAPRAAAQSSWTCHCSLVRLGDTGSGLGSGLGLVLPLAAVVSPGRWFARGGEEGALGAESGAGRARGWAVAGWCARAWSSFRFLKCCLNSEMVMEPLKSSSYLQGRRRRRHASVWVAALRVRRCECGGGGGAAATAASGGAVAQRRGGVAAWQRGAAALRRLTLRRGQTESESPSSSTCAPAATPLVSVRLPWCGAPQRRA